MSKASFFIDLSIHISAQRSVIWTVLTSAQHSKVWATAFSPGWWIKTNGLINSTVEWIGPGEQVFVKGIVVGSVPYKLLKFSYFENPDDPNQVITPDSSFERFTLKDNGTGTLLSLHAGKYNGERQKDLEIESRVWVTALQKIKDIAERI